MKRKIGGIGEPTMISDVCLDCPGDEVHSIATHVESGCVMAGCPCTTPWGGYRIREVSEDQVTAEMCKHCRYYVGQTESGGGCFVYPPKLHTAPDNCEYWQRPPVGVNDPACRFFQRGDSVEPEVLG